MVKWFTVVLRSNLSFGGICKTNPERTELVFLEKQLMHQSDGQPEAFQVIYYV